MKSYPVEFSKRADRKLEKLYSYLMKKAGERTALAYVERLLAFCSELGKAPHRGNLHPELGEGVRVVGFEYTVSVQFRVRNSKVQILNVAYRGENYVLYFRRHSP